MRDTRTQKWVKCNSPPKSCANVFGGGLGILSGKRDIWKAIWEGMEVILDPNVNICASIVWPHAYLSTRVFFRTALSLLLLGVPKPGDPGIGVPTSLCRRPRTRLLARGVAYGGGLYDFAASQSKGVDAEIDGEVTGETG